MNALRPACLAAALALLSLPGSAESLRCNGGIAAEGDSRLSVFYKCGQPLLADSYCAPVYYFGSLTPLPQALGNVVVPCQPVEDWLYDRGAGNFLATVRFRSGIVQSISYGRSPP